MTLAPVYLPVVRPRSWNGDALVNGKLGPCDLKAVYFPGVGNLDLFPTAAESFKWMQILCKQETGCDLSGTGAFRSYVQQVIGLTSNYLDHYNPSLTHGRDGTERTWDGKTWYRLKGRNAFAAPGTSNHGLAIAVDLGWFDGWDKPGLVDIDHVQNALYKKGWEWLLANYQSFGWSHEGAKPGQPGYEAHHIRYVLGNEVSQRVKDIRKFLGIKD